MKKVRNEVNSVARGKELFPASVYRCKLLLACNETPPWIQVFVGWRMDFRRFSFLWGEGKCVGHGGSKKSLRQEKLGKAWE